MLIIGAVPLSAEMFAKSGKAGCPRNSMERMEFVTVKFFSIGNFYCFSEESLIQMLT